MTSFKNDTIERVCPIYVPDGFENELATGIKIKSSQSKVYPYGL